MNSKERVRKAFAHLEPDEVPVFEQEIASNIAGQILHRYAYTGGGGIGWRDVEELTFQGKRDFLIERMVRDLIEIHEKLDMDIIRAPLVPDKNTKGPKKKLDDYTYYYEDEDSGVWSIRRYEPN
ncbi:MAG: hypothetical protein ACUVUS_10145 [Thermoproteota archaeon]